MGIFEIVGAITLVTAIGLIILIGAGLISLQDVYNLASSIVETLSSFSLSLEINSWESLLIFLLTYAMFYGLLFFAIRNASLVNFIILGVSCLILWNVTIYGIPLSYFAILGLVIWIRRSISWA